MIRSLYSGATGMIAQQTNLDVVSNNLANANTAGFKKIRADFEDLLYQIDREPGAPVEPDSMIPTGIQVGLGTRVVGTNRIMTAGNLQVTGNELDVAIEGDGFFQVTLPNGEIAYTRDGSWSMDGEGQIVTSNGHLLEPAIVIPEDALEIVISATGDVSVTLPEEADPQNVGQLELARFVNPGGLKAVGKNLFLETPASGAPIVAEPGDEGMGTTIQTILEMSNVQVVEEMVNMIVAQRAYEANSKTIQTADSLLQIANNLR
ncbi:MAG TPA: flagellar basal-body rod protein FlgG [Synergistaceae bacterium]|jgi:flagellar basal-body rod protein FlgG|nr:flagellar basal-body rod protein FlgG [Synergistaceae bacterium]HPJ25172.1 flagellar basal-body rod protein FlgG [Synergistaceae bacterium]HPQ36756.1 flagellar basal-body rod protein FlgG [Synergistaceae bacterium]